MDETHSHGSPPAPNASPSRFGAWAAFAGVVFVCIVGGAIAVWWTQEPFSGLPKPPNGAGEHKPGERGGSQLVQTSADSASGYLGPKVCAECHVERAREMANSSHFRTCRAPLPSEMPKGFEPGKGSFRPRDSQVRFEMSRQGDTYVQTAITTTPAGEQRTDTRIDLVYGAGGKADDVFLAWHDDGRMFELPMAWLYPIEAWGAAHFDKHTGGDYGRNLTVRCLECHTTWFDHVAGTANQYRREGIILGVTCERCHGPGEDHVKYHRANPTSATTRGVVHPGQLSRERSIEVCTQCHGNAIKHRRPTLSYRPGEKLDDYYKTITPKYTEEDHVANQVKYLRQSKCFAQSETMTCVTCHDPHAPTLEADTRSGRASCLKCHQPAHCDEQDRLPLEVKDKCVECHMPKYVKINVNFQTEDDDFVPPIRRSQHKIAVYPEARNEVLWAFHEERASAESRAEVTRLLGELESHWLGEAERCREQHRLVGAVAALREMWRLQPTPELREKIRAAVAEASELNDAWTLAQYQIRQKQNEAAAQTLEKILKLKPDHAGAHGRLGTLYAIEKKNELAVKHLRAVAEHDPDDAYGVGMLGWLAYLRGDFDEAIEHYRRADEIEPFDAKIHFHLGLAQAKRGLPEARDTFRRVLAIDPNHVEACQNLGLLLLQAGDSEGALQILARANLLSNQQNLDILAALAEAQALAGRFDEAAETATKALESARRTRPGLVPDIERRLGEYRAKAKGR